MNPRWADDSNHEAPEDEPALQAVEEEASVPQSRVRDDSEMDITPIIDMTFLLLIFFVVCSKMDPGSGITLPNARHGDSVPVATAVVFTVSVGGEEALIYKGEGEIEANLLSGSDVAEKENQVTAYIEQQMAENPQITSVLILAEAGVKHRDVSLVMKAAGSAQTTEGSQLHVAVMERP